MSLAHGLPQIKIRLTIHRHCCNLILKASSLKCYEILGLLRALPDPQFAEGYKVSPKKNTVPPKEPISS